MQNRNKTVPVLNHTFFETRKTRVNAACLCLNVALLEYEQNLTKKQKCQAIQHVKT
jgi:hypothetical protein